MSRPKLPIEEIKRRAKDWRNTPKAKARKAELRGTQHYRRVKAEHQMIRYYGIDFETWARMFEAQGGACASCSDPLAHGRSTHIDHDHETGKVRGLLCQGCNIALGFLESSKAKIDALRRYIEKHTAP